MSPYLEASPSVNRRENSDSRHIQVQIPGRIQHAPHIGHHVLAETTCSIDRTFLNLSHNHQIDLAGLSQHVHRDTSLIAVEQALFTPTRLGLVDAGRIRNEVVVTPALGKYMSTYYLPQSQDPTITFIHPFATNQDIAPNTTPYAKGRANRFNVSVERKDKKLRISSGLKDGPEKLKSDETYIQSGQYWGYHLDDVTLEVQYKDAVRMYVIENHTKKPAEKYTTYVWCQSNFLPFGDNDLMGIEDLISEFVALGQHAEKGNRDSISAIGANIVNHVQAFVEWGANSIG